MKTIAKIIVTLGLIAVVPSSCIKETFPTDGVTEEQAGTSVAELVNGINSIMVAFDLLGREFHWDFGYPAMCMIRETMGQDQASIYSNYDQFADWRTNAYQGPSFVYAQYPWTFYYKIIFQANKVILATGENPEGDNLYYRGMAKVYRAMSYLDMARMYLYKGNEQGSFTNLTVPIVTETTTKAEGTNNPRVAPDKMYQFILDDLNAAEKDLENYQRSDKILPNLSVVKGLKARLFLEMGNYADAATAARDAIAGYTPLTAEQWDDPKNGFNNLSSQNSWMWGLRIMKEDRVVTTGICNFISMISREYEPGYAAAGPVKMIDRSLYEQIGDKDFRKRSWLDPDRFIPYQSNLPAAKVEALPDYTQFKFRPSEGNTSDNLIACAADFPLMRVEEMYLIEAEAVGMDNLQQGIELLEDFMNSYRYTDGSYVCEASSKEEFQREVVLQKRIEFWGEGISYFDVKRIGQGVHRGYPGTNHMDDARFNTEGVAPWFNFVISRGEMQNNKALEGFNNPDPSQTVPVWKE